MAYDPSKDVELKAWRIPTGLQISVNQYNGGVPKLRIGPRFIPKAGGGETMTKAGGLTVEEVKVLAVFLPDVLKVMEG